MSTPVLLLVALILGAGVIAYVGDALGRRMGKARLTLLGLRPRHSAVFITTFTGMLIAALTLFLLLLTARTYREVLIRGPQVLKQNRRLEDENRGLEVRQKGLRGLVVTARRDASRAGASLKVAEDKLKAAGAKLLQAERQQADLDRVIARQEKRVAALQKESARIEQGSEQRRRGYQALRETRVIYTNGEEIHRGIIQPSSNSTLMRRRVLAVLGAAGDAALSRGAARGSNGRAVLVVPAVVRQPGGPILRFQESDSIGAIAQQVSAGGTPVVMQVLAFGNSVRGEQVLVRIKLFRDRVVLARGEVLAREDIDASASEEDVSRAVRAFLAGPVRRAATEADLIPRVKATGDPVFFEVDVDRLAALTARVRAMGGRVNLCALAARDTSSGGPLVLDFRLTRE